MGEVAAIKLQHSTANGGEMVSCEEVLSEEVRESFDVTIQILWSHLNTRGQYRRVPLFEELTITTDSGLRISGCSSVDCPEKPSSILCVTRSTKLLERSESAQSLGLGLSKHGLLVP